MKLNYFYYLLFSLLTTAGCSNYRENPKITVGELKQDIGYLASDSLKGRYPGITGDSLAAAFIREQFIAAGLDLQADNGYQYFEVITGTKAGKNNAVDYNNMNGQLYDDFVPAGFSANGTFAAPVVFAGYGFDINTDSLKWNDYANLDVKGKWVLILRGDPEPDNMHSPYIQYAEDRYKAMVAKDQGALGVLLVSGPETDHEDKLTINRAKENSTGIPVIHLKRAFTNDILSPLDKTVGGIEQLLMKTGKTFSFTLPDTLKAVTDVIQNRVTTRNVVALLKGSDPSLQDQLLVIGAHFDHLGMGGPGSTSRVPDTVAVHPGADDNASGVSAMLELAGKLSANRDSLKRSILFVAFSAEEMGLLGSKHFVDSSRFFDAKNVTAMLNLDMVGRLNNKNNLEIGGTGTSAQTEEIISSIPKDSTFTLSFSPAGYGPSDHASFYGRDIPVFFFTTGAHTDYHTPGDVASKIDYTGMVAVTRFIYRLAMKVDDYPEKLTFRESGPKQQRSYRSRTKVTLGFMPDFTSQDNNGLGVDFVSPDRPAANGGMKKGDVITAINGKPVNNIQDYMYRLSQLDFGQTISVEVRRNGKKEVLIIQL